MELLMNQTPKREEPQWEEDTITIHASSPEELTVHFRKYSPPPLPPSPTASPPTAALFLVHGAGQSLRSWIPVVNLMHQLRYPILSKLRIFLLDLRGHGQTTARQNYKLDLAQLVSDLSSFVRAKADGLKVFLAGHSIGGAVCAHAAAQLSGNGAQVAGVVLVDMVEESAAQVLRKSQEWILQRPKTFPSEVAAVDWHLAQGVLHSRAAAQITVPGALVAREVDGKLVYAWRTDLAKTFGFWEGWFKGLSKHFIQLKASMGKLLILHERGRLDQELTIGHMQGKFQLALVPGERVGHFVHEDNPLAVASEINTFMSRYLSAVSCTGLTAAEVIKLKRRVR